MTVAMAAPPVEYRIDSNDIILRVNEEWNRFAVDNGSADLTAAHVVGQSLWNYIQDRDVRQLYRLMFDAVRTKGRDIRFPFRCDSPGLRRYLEMRMSPAPGGLVDFHCTLLSTEAREPVDVASGSGDDPLWLTMCSWCKKVRVDAEWVEVERAISAMALFESRSSLTVTHGVCPACKGNFEAELKGLGLPK